MNKEEARSQFIEMLASDESRLELDRAALLIAAEEYPHLKIENYLDRLDLLADEARRSDDLDAEPLARIMRLSDLLFNDLGFHGNMDNYFDARNSFLNDVIDRRMGIPITLSVVLIEVARRVGLKLFGVGMPGHFIVKYADEAVEILIDPFNGGRLLSEEGCRDLVKQTHDETVQFHPSFLYAATKKQILGRMLQNLKGIYAQAKDHHKTLSVIERLLLINPDAASDLRDRGLVYAAMNRYTQAQEDLESYLRRLPNSEDAKDIQEVVKRLRQRQAGLN